MKKERTEYCSRIKILLHCMYPSVLVPVDESQKDRNSS